MISQRDASVACRGVLQHLFNSIELGNLDTNISSNKMYHVLAIYLLELAIGVPIGHCLCLGNNIFMVYCMHATV
ncbi:unnamed protein product [Musa acuminata subsp. malaccensis]|uniref:(wild Malaysian banana) hypothetical protein n=1 Tax=Musa acuminata subsp. malaccensis TaxID=214687 RepID=A0A804JVY9_MUSAM|nr:unnamed protein product [Musa acuminata subsp. malaccensis]